LLESGLLAKWFESKQALRMVEEEDSLREIRRQNLINAQTIAPPAAGTSPFLGAGDRANRVNSSARSPAPLQQAERVELPVSKVRTEALQLDESEPGVSVMDGQGYSVSVQILGDGPAKNCVPVNANNTNGSPWVADTNNTVPSIRDFDHPGGLEGSDLQLRRINIGIINDMGGAF
jgi:hypothetical protein